MRRSLSLLVTIITIIGLAFIVARFFTENSETIQLQFWYWRTKEVQRGYLIGIVFLMGIVVAGVLTLSTLLSKAFEVARLKREVQALQRLLDQQSKPAASAHS